MSIALWNTSSTNVFSSTEMKIQQVTEILCSSYGEFPRPCYCELNKCVIDGPDLLGGLPNFSACMDFSSKKKAPSQQFEQRGWFFVSASHVSLSSAPSRNFLNMTPDLQGYAGQCTLGSSSSEATGSMLAQ
jgi:hypothetical protein